VAGHSRLSIAEVIRLHTSPRYTVYMMGFSPGFPYLGLLPKALQTPRRASPRTHVPAGSVAIAGRQTGIYPTSSPGGWQLIGQACLPLLNAGQDPPFLLAPGDTVRFVQDA
jgi:KipI family sensor histidine kinase inhibitor